MKLKNFTVLLLFISFSFVAQNKKEKIQITKNYNLKVLNSLKEEYSKDFYKQKNKATLLAAQKGWALTFTDSNGSYYELMRVSEEGKPLYYKTSNVDAANSTRTNFLHNNGGLGLNLEGQGMTAYVWDGGLARGTHQEYDGDGGENRFSIGDGTTALNFHAAHVMGTIISSGFDPNAKGMAPKAKGIGSDWSNDLSEATAAAADGMLLSNHSYGLNANNIPDWFFGAYGQDANNWDNLMYNAPYYLVVRAAGNDGSNNTANANPLEGNSNFDKLSSDNTSKNSLIVANGQDAVINADGSLNSVVRNPGSSEGPTDDLRIKPDLMGNGTGLYSTYEDSDDDYATISGTSMASPNVTGTLLLLQQYFNEKNGSFMRASTLKGLALHTADDVAANGPDAETGWGLMNAKKSAETITKQGLQSIISEIEITQGGTYSIVVKSDGLEPLLASISWTDMPGAVNSGVANDTTPALVNDIDVRVTQNTDTFLPWKLTSVDSNEKGDNIVDPFERVDVPNASGEYTITVTHKGTLVGGSQKVSLIVTGVSSGIALLTDITSKTTCANMESFDFNYVQAIGGSSTFSIEGLPTNATASFSDTTLSSDNLLTVTFGNLDNVDPGLYFIEVVGVNGSETTRAPIQLTIIHDDFIDSEITPLYPINGQKGISSAKIDLSWEKHNNAETYQVEVSDNPSFSTILFTENSNDLQFSVESLQDDTVYYWRVKPENSCGSGVFSSIFSFQTGINDCSNNYTATDLSMAAIDPFTSSVTAKVPFNVTDNLTISKILLTTDITHTSVQELLISLEAPSNIGSTKVVLLDNVCDDTDNISNVTFDNSASDLVCSTTAPAISGSIAPANNMNIPFSGKEAFGEWTLIVFDNAASNGGQINSANITICTSEVNINIPSLTSNEIKVNGNSSYTIISDDIEATTDSEAANQQEFILIASPTKGNLEKNGTILSVGDKFTQQDINDGNLTYVNTQTTSFEDEFKIDVTNGAGGWLPNNTIIVKETTLSIEENTLEGVSFWPNPAKTIFNVKLLNADNKKVTITLFDLQGRKIIQIFENPNNNIFTKEIDLKNISSGIYLLNVQQGNKKATKKIIVSK